jgi:ribosome recycling factor
VIDETLFEAEEKMDKAVQVARDDLGTLRTGRASPSMFARLSVDYYGAPTPVPQMATVTVPEARMAVIKPYDPSQLNAIEKAIRDSDLGVNPTNDGMVIRVVFPQLTEERRRDLVKVVHGIAEQGRVSIRNVRRDTMQDLREMKKEGEIGADDEHRAEADLQKLTDLRIADIDGLLAGKEEEIMGETT